MSSALLPHSAPSPNIALCGHARPSAWPAKVALAFPFALAILLTPHSAQAETNANFQVRASIVNGCFVDGSGSSGNVGQVALLDFGTAPSLSTARLQASSQSNQSIRLRCTPNLTLNIKLDGGQQPAAGSRRLRMGRTANHIPYRVCRDAACNNIIPIDGTTSTTISAAAANDVRLNLFADLTLPGRLPAGTYADSVLVTLSW